MRGTTSIKSFGVALAIILMMVLMGGCERKIIPGNPFDEYDPGEENYSTCYDDEELEIRFTGDYPSVVTMDMVAEDGIPYTIETIEGQVCVWFEETVSYGDASKAIKKTNGKIVAQISKNGYYLVEVPTNNVKNFTDAISMQYGVDWAYPNIVFFPSMVNNYVLDTEYPDVTEADTPPHGIIVKYALWDSDPESPLKSYNIGSENGKGMNLDNWDEGGICPIFGCSHNEYFALKDISRIPDNEPIIINMSYGPALKRNANGKELRVLWKSATYEEKQNYKENYVYYIKSKIKNLSPLQGKDYIAVIAAGNDGIKDFDAEILSFLRNKLSSEEKEIMDKHVLLVTAGETEKVNQDYSNEMERGIYDPWVTKTDISDFKFEGKKWKGTSFAAPRAAGILSSVANEMNLTGAEVLELAREVTKRDGELTKESLLKATEDNKPSSNEYSINGCLLYRLITEIGTDMEILELHNNCNEDIRVKGYLLNAIAPHGGANTLDFDKVIKANQTEYVEGFIENECTIISVEKVIQNQKQQKNNTKIVGTMWRWDFSKNPDIEWYDALRFDDESNGTALSIYQGESTVITHFHYFYNEEYDGWYVTDWGKNIMYFVINGNELNMGFYKPCVINGKNIVFDSRCYYRM